MKNYKTILIKERNIEDLSLRRKVLIKEGYRVVGDIKSDGTEYRLVMEKKNG